MRRISGLSAVAALCAVGAATGMGVGETRAADPYYKDKQVKLVNFGGAAGSYAIYTRIYAKHVGKHLPGNPSVVVDFMGGGGLKGQNYLANAAPRDGLFVGMPMPSAITAPLIHKKNARFDPAKFMWFGNITQLQTGLGVWKAATPVRSIADAKKTEVVIGSSGKTSELTLTPQLLNAIIGTKFKIVQGYKSLGPINLALEKGEVQGRSGGMTAWHPLKPNWFQPDEKVAFLAQVGMSRHPAVPNIPLVTELTDNAEDKAVLELLCRSTVLTRPVAGPPGMPRKLVNQMRAAFDATLKDPEFAAEMKKRRMQMINPMTWQEIEKFVADTQATSPKVIKRFQDALGIKG
jgi:tripartite-type tricarboxylate transporter receptor subunit TctC